jgi:hypothetical protein
MFTFICLFKFRIFVADVFAVAFVIYTYKYIKYVWNKFANASFSFIVFILTYTATIKILIHLLFSLVAIIKRKHNKILKKMYDLKKKKSKIKLKNFFSTYIIFTFYLF